MDRGHLEQTPLQMAVAEDNPVLTRILLEAGADVNAQAEYTLTPLHLAVLRQNPDIVSLLLDDVVKRPFRISMEKRPSISPEASTRRFAPVSRNDLNSRCGIVRRFRLPPVRASLQKWKKS